ncbi:hypothetical protein [Edaphobacter aggregans]|uniref:hypothetical protein n=1 Tax=Edaphobacter aggregans TaxID=570835 RepID=UPI0012FA1BBD|nr:hypothetical protein [Edaphobacter aggregans]
MGVLGQAVARGSAEEDDSQGYMISIDPSLKAVNLAMRAYALEREPEIRNVLQTAGDPKQRRAAAALLGYVHRSQTQAITKTIILPCRALLLFISPVLSQVGPINYFGYGGLPLEKVRSVLPLHTGDTLTYATFSKKPINDAVLGAIGKAWKG